jgi:hypothetical protein
MLDEQGSLGGDPMVKGPGEIETKPEVLHPERRQVLVHFNVPPAKPSVGQVFPPKSLPSHCSVGPFLTPSPHR